MNICPACTFRSAAKSCPHDGYPMVDEGFYATSIAEPDLIGQVFDERYEVESLIGRGGMGWVFKAKHLTMHHDVALKLLRRDVGADMNAVKRFHQEARTCAQLKHPNTIKVHDFGASPDGTLYLAMELLEGEPLSHLVGRGAGLGVGWSTRVARQVCDSLDEAHEMGLVHRDLKPDNVFLTRVHRMADFVKVLDFGIAKLVQEGKAGKETLTSTGVVVGTPKYMSPEQAQSKPLDRRSDLYSLGIILYEMLAGYAPFQAPSALALLMEHISAPPPPLPAVVDGEAIPEGLRALVAQLLAKRPEQRPASGAEVADRLAAVAGAATRAASPVSRRPAQASRGPVVSAPPAGVGGAAGPGEERSRGGDDGFATTDAAAVLPPRGVAEAAPGADELSSLPTRIVAVPAKTVSSATTAAIVWARARARWPWALVAVVVGAGAWVLWPSSPGPGTGGGASASPGGAGSPEGGVVGAADGGGPGRSAGPSGTDDAGAPVAAGGDPVDAGAAAGGAASDAGVVALPSTGTAGAVEQLGDGTAGSGDLSSGAARRGESPPGRVEPAGAGASAGAAGPATGTHGKGRKTSKETPAVRPQRPKTKSKVKVDYSL